MSEFCKMLIDAFLMPIYLTFPIFGWIMDQEPIARYTTNGISGNPRNTIIKATVAGMLLMSMVTVLGGPILLAMIALLSGILLTFGYTSGEVSYTLTPSGLNREVRRFIPYYLKGTAQQQFIPWVQIESYKRDRDLSRGLETYHFLRIYLHVRPGQIWINDKNQPEAFAAFADAFEQEVARAGESRTDPSNPSVEIRKRAGFYKSPFAILLTLIFFVLTVGIGYYAVVHGMRAHNWYRLLIILVPGTLYMSWRVWNERRRF